MALRAGFCACFSWAGSSSELEESSELPELDADEHAVLLAGLGLAIGVEVAGCALRCWVRALAVDPAV